MCVHASIYVMAIHLDIQAYTHTVFIITVIINPALYQHDQRRPLGTAGTPT